MEQKRDREQQIRRDKRSNDSKRGRSNKAEGKISAPWRNVQAQEKNNSETSSSTTVNESDSEDQMTGDGRKSGVNFSKRQIESNWSKYEVMLPGDDDVSKASDFESLISVPISEGGHFKFKSEQAWETYSPSQFSDLFSLDLNMFSTSLSTIPFYGQLNLPQELFDQDELSRMENEASENLAKYNVSLKETSDIGNRPVLTTNNAKSSEEIMKTSLPHDIVERIGNLKCPSQVAGDDSHNLEIIEQSSFRSEALSATEKDDELDFLLALKEPLELFQEKSSNFPIEHGTRCADEEITTPLPSVSCPAKKEDLEDWLDSILDD